MIQTKQHLARTKHERLNNTARQVMKQTILAAKAEFDKTVMRDARLSDYERSLAWREFLNEWGSKLEAIYS